MLTQGCGKKNLTTYYKVHELYGWQIVNEPQNRNIREDFLTQQSQQCDGTSVYNSWAYCNKTKRNWNLIISKHFSNKSHAKTCDCQNFIALGLFLYWSSPHILWPIFWLIHFNIFFFISLSMKSADPEVCTWLSVGFGWQISLACISISLILLFLKSKPNNPMLIENDSLASFNIKVRLKIPEQDNATKFWNNLVLKQRYLQTFNCMK